MSTIYTTHHHARGSRQLLHSLILIPSNDRSGWAKSSRATNDSIITVRRVRGNGQIDGVVRSASGCSLFDCIVLAPSHGAPESPTIMWNNKRKKESLVAAIQSTLPCKCLHVLPRLSSRRRGGRIEYSVASAALRVALGADSRNCDKQGRSEVDAVD